MNSLKKKLKDGEITVEQYQNFKKSSKSEYEILLSLRKSEEKKIENQRKQKELLQQKRKFKEFKDKIRNLKNGFKILLTIVLVILLTLMIHEGDILITRGDHYISIVLNDGLFTLSFFTLVFYSIFWGIKKEPN